MTEKRYEERRKEKEERNLERGIYTLAGRRGFLLRKEPLGSCLPLLGGSPDTGSLETAHLRTYDELTGKTATGTIFLIPKVVSKGVYASFYYLQVHLRLLNGCTY
jgi:hypothetical protein